MKLIAIASAGLLALAALLPTAATAQHGRVVTRTVTTTRVVNRNGGYHAGRRYRVRHVCRNEWRYHHRVRICRDVRY